MDSNEIIAKSNETTGTILYLQGGDGGPVWINGKDENDFGLWVANGKIHSLINVEVLNSTTGNTVYLNNANSGNQGIYTRGYYNGSDFVESTGWVAYRGTASNCGCSFKFFATAFIINNLNSVGCGTSYPANPTKGQIFFKKKT